MIAFSLKIQNKGVSFQKNVKHLFLQLSNQNDYIVLPQNNETLNTLTRRQEKSSRAAILLQQTY